MNVDKTLSQYKWWTTDWSSMTRGVLVTLVLLGVYNLGGHALGYNAIERLSSSMNGASGKVPWNKMIYVVMALAGLALASVRTTWITTPCVCTKSA